MRSHQLHGQRFGRLTAINRVKGTSHGVLWECKCECGGVYSALASRLVTGYTTHCGCLTSDLCRTSSKHSTHGMTNSPEWNSWNALRARCRSTSHISYAYYGAKGIAVCERWSSFENFFADMGCRPSPQHSIERKDNSKGYCPENCIWATKKQQSRNRSCVVLLEMNGRTQCVAAWAEEFAMPRSTLRRRLSKGMSIQDALNAPRLKAGCHPALERP